MRSVGKALPFLLAARKEEDGGVEELAWDAISLFSLVQERQQQQLNNVNKQNTGQGQNYKERTNPEAAANGDIHNHNARSKVRVHW